MNFNLWKNKWKEVIAWFAFLFIIFFSAYKMQQHISVGHDWGGDFALYVDQGQAIVSGDLEGLYQKSKFTVDYSSRLQGPYLYPMGYPLLLSPIVAALGLNFFWLKLFTSLFFYLGLVVLFLNFKKAFKELFSPLWIVSLIAISDHYLFHGDQILSDFPFFFFCFLSLLLFKKEMKDKRQILLGFLIFFTFLIRDLGALLLVSLFAYQFFNSNWKVLIKSQSYTYITFSLLLILSFVVFPFGSKNHYELFVNKLGWESFTDNLEYYLSIFEMFFRGAENNPWLEYMMLALLLFGMWLSFKKHIHFVSFFILGLLVLLLWPYHQSIRFLFPLIPLCLFFMLQAVAIIPKWPRYLIAFPLIVYASFFFFQNSMALNEQNLKLETNQIYQEENLELYEYVNQNFSKEDTIVFFKPRVLRMFCGVNTLYLEPYKFSNSPYKYLITYKPWTDNKGLDSLRIKKDFPSFTVYSK